MSLNLTLKPYEKIFIGGAVVRNSAAKTELTILNDVPVMRQKEIMLEAEAITPCTRIYLAIQQLYMDERNRAGYMKLLVELVRDVAAAAPSTIQWLEEIGRHIIDGRYYQALKVTKQLIHYETELLRNAR